MIPAYGPRTYGSCREFRILRSVGTVPRPTRPQERRDDNVGVVGELQLNICGLAATAGNAIDEPLVALADQRLPSNQRASIDAVTANWASRAISNVASPIDTAMAAPGVRVQRPHGPATADDCAARLRRDN